MRYLYVLVITLLVVAPAFAQEGDCGLESLLVAGGAGKVSPGDANNVRDAASVDGELVGQIEAGQVFGVLEERACSEGFSWVEVEFADGGEVLTGWTVEATSDSYFVEPLEGIFVSASNGVTSVSVVLPSEVASAAEVTIDEGIPVDENDPYAYFPASIKITFVEDYLDSDYYEPNAPAITIFASNAFEDDQTVYGGSGTYAVEGISAILEDRPDLTTFGTTFENGLPDFSPGAAMLMLAHLEYLDFAAGSGVRYLALYAQENVSPTNTNILYRYQGLTADGAYFIDSTMPIDAPNLPPTIEEVHDGTDNFGEQYSVDNSVFFSEIALEDFTPNLTLLDAVIASLWVE